VLRRPYFRNRHSLGALSAGLFGQATLVVSGPATARLLGVTGRGQLAILAIVAMISSQVGAAGLPTAVTYIVAMRGISARAVLSTMASTWVSLCIVAGIVGAGVTVALGSSASPSVWLDALLVATWIVSGMTYTLGLACLQGESRFRPLNWARPIASTVSAVGLLCLLLLAHRAAVASVLSVIVLGNLLACLVTARLAFAAHSTAAQAVTPNVGVGQLLRYGLASLAGATAPIDSLSIDQAIVGVMLSRGQLGLYAVAGSFNSLPSVLLSSLGTIALPRIAGESQEAARLRIIKRTAIIAALVAGITTLFAELIVAWLLPLAFGASFAPAVPAARILIVAGFFLSIRRILVVFVQAVGRPGHTGVGEMAALAVLVLCAVLLVPRLGIAGASSALLVAAVASDVYLWLVLRRPRAENTTI
jgi:O-antigen/teichoic acid export membrane protein